MPPVELWAEVRFQWPAEYTALSLYGDGVFCDLYHPEDEACRHREGMADIFVDLEIDFLMPFDFVQQLDSDEGIEVTSRRIRQAFAEEVDHDNIVRVEAKASYDGTDLRLVSIKARYFWILQDELRDLSMLKAVLLSICEEIHRVLQRFNRAFVPPGGSSGP
jgi:hypothetical protein